MTKRESIEYLKSIKGNDMFPFRPEFEQEIVMNELLLLEREIQCALPRSYTENYIKYDLSKFVFGNKDYPPDLIFQLVANDIKGEFKHILNEFLDLENILDQWVSVGKEEQEMYQWGLLKIGFTPWQGGIYLGIEKGINYGRIYWIRTGGYISEEFKFFEISDSDREGIRLVADNISQYIDSLYIAFEDEIIDY